MIIKELPTIDSAINEESWHWLQDCLPALAAAVASEVARGASADEIRRHVFRRTHRHALAMRCSQAVEYLIRNRMSVTGRWPD
jgi:hypothetical protein